LETNKEKQYVIEFFMKLYPFSKLDPNLFFAELWPRMTAVTFQEGHVLKDYDNASSEIFIIFSGEATVYAKAIEGSSNNGLKVPTEVELNKYTKGAVLCEN
jgi:signal-transduction protein with cAMP-binding, CBS, and nucleotidyltransferase domain